LKGVRNLLLLQGSVAAIPNSQGVHVVLYQYQTCPFCNKVRAYLDMHKVPFTVVEVNPLFKGELAFSKAYRNVPIAVVNGTQVNNSGDIISHVESLLASSPSAAAGTAAPPGTAMTGAEVQEWCRWVDETLARTLAPNIYRTWGEAVSSFDYITEHSNFGAVSGAVTKYAGAAAMFAIGKRLKRKYGFEDERAALYSAVTQWLTHGVGGKAFAGGDTPNTADVEVFGVLRSLLSYEAWQDVQQHTEVEGWYTRMTEAVGPSSQQHKVGMAPTAVLNPPQPTNSTEKR
jgi:microsomal prostaglandin-E synthase 2